VLLCWIIATQEEILTFSIMASDSNAATNKPSTPFEWLSGGLFFGKSKGGIESIDSSKDVQSLLSGLQANLDRILALKQQPDTEEGGTEESNDPSKFLAARLSRLRFLLYDERRMTSQQEPRRGASPAVAGATLAGLTKPEQAELIPRLLENLSELPFESRKHVAAVFNYMLVCGLEGSDASLYQPAMEQFRDYVESLYERLLTTIINGHEEVGDIALHFGSMYRSCIRHPSLYRQLVGTTERAQSFVFPFLDKYVHLPNFDVSSDAMESLRLVCSAGGDRVADEEAQQAMAAIAADFFIRDYEALWEDRFNGKLLADTANYMTRRCGLQILSSALLTRSNYEMMIRYVQSRSNLILVMGLLRDTSPHITLDAFHVFKVFVANPNKPPEIIKILRDNKVKLCRYLTTLHQDREESDTQFRDEKALIIATIEGL